MNGEPLFALLETRWKTYGYRSDVESTKESVCDLIQDFNEVEFGRVLGGEVHYILDRLEAAYSALEEALENLDQAEIATDACIEYIRRQAQ